MLKERKAGGSAKKSRGAAKSSDTARPTIKVTEADKTPHEDLMKLPKVYIVRSISVPENVKRYLIDIDSQSALGKRVIKLMETLRIGDAARIKTVSEVLGALANLV